MISKSWKEGSMTIGAPTIMYPTLPMTVISSGSACLIRSLLSSLIIRLLYKHTMRCQKEKKVLSNLLYEEKIWRRISNISDSPALDIKDLLPAAGLDLTARNW